MCNVVASRVVCGAVILSFKREIALSVCPPRNDILRSSVKDPQHYPILTQVIGGDANQQQTTDDIDDPGMTREEYRQLALERSREQRKN